MAKDSLKRSPNDAIFVPGGVIPAALTYDKVLEELAGEARPILHDLEIYRGDAPPADYAVELEVGAIGRAADDAGVARFHLIGYSAGADFALAYAAVEGQRLRSLTLIEPDWIGNDDWAPGEPARRLAMERALGLPTIEEKMGAYMLLFSVPGTQPPMPLGPPGGPRPPWMSKRPAALVPMNLSLLHAPLDRDRLRALGCPVYLPVGGQTHPRFRAIADLLAATFPKATVEVYEERSHFDPPHRAEPRRLADELRRIWSSE